MQFLSVAALATLATTVAAGAKWKDNNCLTDAGFQRIIDNSIIFLEHTDVAVANATAQVTFSPNIIETGDSINSLRGDALGTVVSSNSTQYIGDELSAPGIPSIQTIDGFHTCDRFLWYWEFDGVGPQRIRGVTIGTVDLATGLVSRQVVEFNSLAWAEDVGYTVTPPSSKKTRREIQW